MPQGLPTGTGPGDPIQSCGVHQGGSKAKPLLPREAPGAKTESMSRTNSGRPNAPTAAEEQTLPPAETTVDHQPKQRKAANEQNWSRSQKIPTQPPPTTAAATGINPELPHNRRLTTKTPYSGQTLKP
ncbi:hypothetical protein RHMOL_Rhmol08G0190400 [Rhododendron molle]|uniref:Uncharacterized protein n=1 Tax=Rhododendron molle TaxID=49168 RepID=A0ACC0MR96_RHOML|nr:hypothetical protein RHMOL_Rhmol08G0190400 [Rhododendron molle]